MLSDGLNTYQYDAEGNLIQSNGSATQQYTYNALNQQVRFDFNSPTFSVYIESIFNAQGKFSANWNTGSFIGAEAYWGSTPVESYFAPSIATAHFLLRDGLGSMRFETDNTGAVTVNRYTLPFGDGTTAVSGSRKTNDGFAGLPDGPNGNHAQFREYSNLAGRWMQPDPYGGSYDALSPQSLNRYSYVLNNPLRFVDPLGLDVGDQVGSYNGVPIIQGPGLTGCGYSCSSWGGSGGSVHINGPDLPVDVSGSSGGGSTATSNQILPCFVKGAATGAVGALVVGGAAAGAVALGIVSAPVVTAALGVAAVAGGAYAIYSGIQQARAGNWAGVAFGVGSFAGAAVVGGAGGRALAETINGVASPAWSIGSDWAQGYRSNFPGGSLGKWWNSGTNPGSAGGSAASAGAGAATAVKKGC
jgi:RHS repeat-associated protein